MNPELKITFLEHGKDLPCPAYQTCDASGMDLHAAVSEPVTIAPGKIKLIPTGLSIELPSGYEAQIRPRSGLALKHGIGIVNSPGTIDADYRGEIGIIVINLGEQPFVVERGMRIAQMIIQTVCQAKIKIVDALSETQRSSGGFGHTGK